MELNTGESGHPCENPSWTFISVQVPSSSLRHVVPVSSYRQSMKFARSGNSVATISSSFWRDIALNMFRMSRDTSALEGISPRSSYWNMYFSRARRRVVLT